MDRTCEQCRRPFTVKPGPGRPRRKCEECSPRENRGAPVPASKPAEVRQFPAPAPVGPAAAGRGVISATEAALAAAGRDESPLGAIAMQLARSIVMGTHTAAGLAALSKELRATLDAALAGAPVADDEIDELTKRRLRKASGA